MRHWRKGFSSGKVQARCGFSARSRPKSLSPYRVRIMRSRALTTALSLATALVALSACRIIPASPVRPHAPASTPAPASAPAPLPPPTATEPEVLAPEPDVHAGGPPATDFYTPQSPPPRAPYEGPPLAYTRIGETVFVDGPKVTPLALLEDSRCAEGTQCVWAGRLRVRVRVDLGSGPREVEMTLGQPVQIADGQLDLLDALPRPTAGRKPAPFAYQFGFRFMGGL